MFFHISKNDISPALTRMIPTLDGRRLEADMGDPLPVGLTQRRKGKMGMRRKSAGSVQNQDPTRFRLSGTASTGKAGLHHYSIRGVADI
jgi:hypothetical protein